MEKIKHKRIRRKYYELGKNSDFNFPGTKFIDVWVDGYLHGRRKKYWLSKNAIEAIIVSSAVIVIAAIISVLIASFMGII